MRTLKLALLLAVVLVLAMEIGPCIKADRSAYRGSLQTLPDTIDCAKVEVILTSPRVQWTMTDLPKEVRARASLTASQVPPFPHDDPRLMNPRNWPATMNIAGVTCSLTIEAFEYDASRIVRSLDDVKPKERIGLSYSAVSGSGPGARRGPSRGPSYWWTPDGNLVERAWTYGSVLRGDHCIYQYYSSGDLFAYEDGRHAEVLWLWSSHERFEEIFARNGTLIACQFASSSWSGPERIHSYWLGRGIDLDGYSARMREAMHCAWK